MEYIYLSIHGLASWHKTLVSMTFISKKHETAISNGKTESITFLLKKVGFGLTNKRIWLHLNHTHSVNLLVPFLRI